MTRRIRPHLRRLGVIAGSLALGSVLVTSGLRGFAATVPISSGGVVGYRTCVLTATPSSTSVVADTWVNQQNQNQNLGSSTSLSVQTRSGDRNQRVYVNFDITACDPRIPSTATVRSATLRLFLTALPSACRTYDVFRVTSAWGETSITWNTQPFGTSSNNPPTAQRTTTTTIGAGCANSSNNAYVTGWNVTADVQAFVSEVQGLHGWMIRDNLENDTGGGITVTFAAKEAGLSTRAPQLLIVYSA